MQVLHLPVNSLPWYTGGKEVFTHSLATALCHFNIRSQIAFHQNPFTLEPVGHHIIHNLATTVLPATEGAQTRTAIYSCSPSGIPGFRSLLDELQPDIVHFQDFSVGASLSHMRAAKRAGCGIVMTYHSPGQVCTQRALLYRGTRVCDGRLDTSRCTRCRLGVLGVPEWLAGGLARFGDLGFRVDTSSRMGRALTVQATVRLFEKAWAECVALVDRFTVHADWCADLLRANGVPDHKLEIVRSGWHGQAQAQADGKRVMRPRGHGASLRIACIGRADPVKGMHVLVNAVQALPHELPLEINFFGPYWTEPYGRGLLQQIHDDKRFCVPEQLEPAELMRRLSDFDICVVPSLCLETGPLVVLESFAAQVPVIGSRLGGIAESVREGVDGLLFKAGDVSALAGILRRLSDQPNLLEHLRAGIRPPRTMADVAQEMSAIYRGLLSERLFMR